jgi:hypothetical protein
MDIGFGILPSLFSEDEIEELIQVLPPINSSAGTRSLLDQNWCRKLAQDQRLLSVIESLIGSPATARRGILFDKSREANWTLGWHQDTKIAVKERVDGLDGYSNWSVKEGITRVQPPRKILENSVAIRIHLDQCDATNSALRVIPSSHLPGFLQNENNEPECALTLEVDSGDIIWMRPLVFHASGKASAPNHRRVIHLECCSMSLPPPLEWFY